MLKLDSLSILNLGEIILKSSSEENLLYEYGFACYNQGLFDKATTLFRLLTIIQPTEFRNWFALGSSLMMSSEHEDALQAFQIAETKDQGDPRSYLHQAECLTKLGLKKEALEKLTIAETLTLKKSYRDKIELLKTYCSTRSK